MDIRNLRLISCFVTVDVLLFRLFDRKHGQGVIESTSMNETGHSVEYFALLILIILSSSGCRIISSTERLNSGRGIPFVVSVQRDF